MTVLDISGVLVQKDFSHTIMLPEELATYTQLKTNILLIDRVGLFNYSSYFMWPKSDTIIQRQNVPFHLPIETLIHTLERILLISLNS